MTSEIRTNSLKSRAGLSTVTLTDSGPMFSGITTFVDNSTFSVGTGGTIHAPSTNTLNIGVNNTESLRIDSNSNLKVAGIVTATHFHGDGSNLTGISAGTSLSGSTNNTVCTVTGANAIQGEANLTFDGSNLGINGDLVGSNNTTLYSTNGGSGVRAGLSLSGSDQSIKFYTVNGGSERLRIDSTGRVLIGTIIQGTAGADKLTLSTGGSTGITIRSGSSNDGNLYFAMGTTGNETYRGFIQYEHSNNAFRFGTNAAERLRIDSVGRVMIGTTTEGNGNADEFTISYINHAGVSGGDQGRCGMTIRSGDNTSGVTQNGYIYFSDGTSGANESKGVVAYEHSTDSMYLSTDQVARLRIDSNGKVSIASAAYGGGGVTPELYVRGTSGRQVKIHNTNAATCSVQLTNSASGEGEDHGMQFALLGGGGGYFKHHVNNANVLDMYSQVSGSGKYIMKIYNDGKIGQQSNSDCLMLSTSQNGSGNQYFLRGSKNSTQPGGGNDVVWIYEDGDIYNNNQTYGQQSDIKLKENIVDASSQWNDIKNLKVRNFNFKASTGYDTHTQIGLVAQEAELVSPGLIKVVKDRKKTEEKNELGSISYKESLSETETTKYVKYSVLHMKAIKCLQEAQARIETLEQENIALRVRVTNLEDN